MEANERLPLSMEPPPAPITCQGKILFLSRLFGPLSGLPPTNGHRRAKLADNVAIGATTHKTF